jgi:transcriptional regulator with XRE-family HTH domain
MVGITQLRLARLQRGWTLDDLFLRSDGRLSPGRLSRIERGLCAASLEESALLVKLLSVSQQTVLDAGASTAFALAKSAGSGTHQQPRSKV